MSEKPLWNPDGDGLRGGKHDQAFEQLVPATGRVEPFGPDEPFVNAGPTDGAGPGDGGAGAGTLDDVIIIFNGTADYTSIVGDVTGPV